MINYNQGDIILVLFPESDLRTIKKRPAVVVQSDTIDSGINQVIIAMITSNISRRFHKSRIFIDSSSEEWNESGLLSDSIIMTDNLATIRTIEIYKKLGKYPNLDKLKECLRFTFNI